MDIHIPVSLAPKATLVLKDADCKLTDNGTHYVYSLNYEDCQTTVTVSNGIRTIQNEISVYTSEDPSAKVVFLPRFTIPLICETPEEEFESVMGQFKVKPKSKIIEKITLARHNFTLREFRDEQFQDEVQEPYIEVSISSFFYVEVSVDSPDVPVRVHQCYATPTTDTNDENLYLLIDDGCPVGKGVQLLTYPGQNKFRFSVQTFYFQKVQTKDVYLHCDVNVGRSHRTCEGSPRRIRKRSVQDLIGAAVTTLTSTKHVMA